MNARPTLPDAQMPPYVLGTMALTGYYGPVNENQAAATIARYLDAGGRYIDTADLYADGANEILVGRCLGPLRKNVVLATKFGYTFGERADQRGLDARPERVEPACDASLRRLGTDHIDIYYLHRVDSHVPIEDTWCAMARLVEKGKVRALGLCEVGPAIYRRAAAIHPVAAVQSEYSLWSREPEEEMLEFLQAQGAWFFGYASLGRGFLSGAVRKPEDFPPEDQRRDMPRFQGENFRRNLELVDALRAMAAEMGVSAAQLALAWCRRHLKASPIAGATAPEHIDDAQAALALSVPAEVWARIDAVFPLGAAAGQRYSASAMKRLQSGR
ncbi:aldo/keto reductase [Cupriavidus basilensis]|uniref:Aldo/keto reductase n=1 Tax=Cupriavidus basilensis TaxID=68895 RepID=A0ABT6ANM9_9BURK|nr:aldo/keto reductase [Cupriavidus basilensis]MDF3834203.1 aldo/keto reductase [Cupriavidus basilensis]